MILLFPEERDISTDNVTEWLHFYGAKFLRINEDNQNVIKSVEIDDCDTRFEFSINNLGFDEIGSVWFRRGALGYRSDFETISGKSHHVNRQIANHIYREMQTIFQFIYLLLQSRYTINAPTAYNLNKLEMLFLAKQAGLHIPETLVTNNYEMVKDWGSRADGLITKALSDNIDFYDENRNYGMGTKGLPGLANKFYYSLFQFKIDRYCEIRTFYIEDEFYSMAIFVDEDLVDVRSLRLDNNKARLVPYKLPKQITQKLLALTKSKGINCGSIDLILTKDKRYVFLELNPVGQYDYLEKCCNYPISKIMAEKLIKHEQIF